MRDDYLPSTKVFSFSRLSIKIDSDICKFRTNVAVSACPDANQNSQQSAEDALRDQILSSALSNVTEIIQDSVNVNAKTAEEFNAEAQRIIRHYRYLKRYFKMNNNF